MQELKDKLRTSEVSLYQWIPTAQMWADSLTKEMEMPDGLERMMKKWECRLVEKEINKVICKDNEIRILNIEYRGIKTEEGDEGEKELQERQSNTWR